MGDIRELVLLIDRFIEKDGSQHTAVPRLILHRESATNGKLFTLCKPTLCLVAQGHKQSSIGNESFAYGAGTLLTISVEMPVTAQVFDANPERPLLCAQLELDPVLLGSVIVEGGAENWPHRAPQSPASVEIATSAQIGAFIRLLGLLDEPADIRMLAPLIERELLYRLLRGPHFDHLRRIAFAGGRVQQVNKAISLIKENFREGLSVDDLAAKACMSASALHHHFKAVTGLSPLQYQKHLRLQEARRLMLNKVADAATAGHLVGYDSPSQFSREYRRLFGAPPLRHVAGLRPDRDQRRVAV